MRSANTHADSSRRGFTSRLLSGVFLVRVQAEEDYWHVRCDLRFCTRCAYWEFYGESSGQKCMDSTQRAAAASVPPSIALAKRGLATLATAGDAKLYPALPRAGQRRRSAAQLLDEKKSRRTHDVRVQQSSSVT